MAHRLAALTVVVAAALAFVGGAAAALSLTLGTAPSFNVSLDGTDQTVPFSFTMTVAGANNSGWNITASATTFTASGHSLGLPTLTSIPAGACTGGGCSNAVNLTTSYPIALTGTAQKIFSDQAGSGKGTIPLTANLTIGVGGNAFAGSYASTLTLTIVSGP
ncbi:MAG: hypothetical protein ACYDA3_12775 [Gaiellaceae bacterium]